MAEVKKTTVAKAAAKPADTKNEEVVKTEAAAPVKEAAKAAKKTTAKKATKAAAKKSMAKEVKEAEVKETEVKTTGRKAAAKAVVHLQFAGKSYTSEDLIKSAKDVWQYDLNRKPEDFKSVELYVKPEEHKVYYVVNDNVAGDFNI